MSSGQEKTCDCDGCVAWRGCKFGQPEAPKGPAAEAGCSKAELDSTLRGLSAVALRCDLAAANARIAEALECQASTLRECSAMVDAANARADSNHAAWKKADAAVDAANARIAELRQLMNHNPEYYVALADAANARAEAAERALKQADTQLCAWEAERDQLAQKLEAAELRQKTLGEWLGSCQTERDQLAARLTEAERVATERHHAYCKAAERVTELEEGLEERLRVTDSLAARVMCTPEERQVLEAAGEISSVALDAWVELGDSFTGLSTLARAELANRAAKAKRGDK